MSQGEEETKQYMTENGVSIEVKKMGSSKRHIKAKIAINASLETIWNIMVDYEEFGEVIPGLVVCKLLERKGNVARIHQVSQQNLPLGMKFKSKATLDSIEKELETFEGGIRRDIEFKMVEGDFQCFEGKWCIEQMGSGEGTANGKKYETTLTYIAEVKPAAWVPINLVEGKLCKEMQTNLQCIKDVAEKKALAA